MKLGTTLFAREPRVRNPRRRLGGLGRVPGIEGLEPRHLLAGSPAVIAFDPVGLVTTPVTELRMQLSDAVVGDGARNASSYDLIHLGADRVVGGSDDQTISIFPVYVDGGTQVSLLSPSRLNNWQEIDYGFPAGILGDWQLNGGGTSVTQVADGGTTFFVSDHDFADGRFSARIKVDGAATDDDYVGVVFGLQTNPATQLPDQYYLLAWKRAAQADAEAGLKLAKVTGTGVVGQRPDLWDLDDADPRISILSQGPAAGWTAGVDYDVVVDYAQSGDIRVQVVQAFTGQAVWDTEVHDASPLGAGKVGFYNFGQAGTRYDSLSFLSPLPDGEYQIRARSSDTALRGLDGSLLDGNNNGVGGDDFVGTFGVDTAPATISLDLRAASDTGASADDNITRLTSLTFDVMVSEIGRINLDFDGNNTVDATQFAAAPGKYSFTRNYATAGAYSVVASFQAASGETPQSTLPVTIDTRGPSVVTLPQYDSSPWSSISIDFNEAIDPATFSAADVELTGPDGELIAVSSIAGVGATYTVNFAEQTTAGTYVLRIGPQIMDPAGNLMNQDGDGAHGEAVDDVAYVPVSVNTVEQSVLFVNVNGSANTDGWHLFQTLLQAGAHARWAHLSSAGQVDAVLQSANFDQIWVYDLSSAADNFVADWQAIGDWFNADPSRAIIADGRILSSYWNGRYVSEGARLTENYYDNMKLAGGGLLLGTDHSNYHNGINAINDHIGIDRFSGNLSAATIPVDTGNPLMKLPNDLGGVLFGDSTVGQTPYDLQPNGRILCGAAWHGGNVNTPVISSTICNVGDFRVEIVSPTSGAQFSEGQQITFTAIASNSTPPLTYAWSAKPAGDPAADPVPLGSEATVVATLLPGSYLVTVLAQDVLYSVEDSILLTVQAIPGTITLDLVVDSDTGVSPTDNITADATPTFQVTVNKAGSVALDFDNDGAVDGTIDASAAGTYSITPSELADGPRPVRATFTPLLGSVAQATLNVTVDTLSPLVLPGQATQQAPMSQRTIIFNESIVAASFTVAGSSLTGPAAAGALAVLSVSGSGATYAMGFNPLFVAGNYSIGLPNSITDLAGNAINPATSVLFELLADVTQPFVVSYAPVGIQGTDVTRMTARFSEPMLASSFAIDDVSVLPPPGAAAPQISLVRLLPGSDREFEIVFSQPLATTGVYRVTVGPNVTDLAGNAMSTYQALFTIDKTGPQVTTMVPLGTVMQVVSFVDVTFDEPINSGTFASADVTINGPSGFVNVTSIARLSGNTYRMHFAPQRTNGSYTIDIGPDIADTIGNTMNQGPGPFRGQFTISLPDLIVDAPVGAPTAANFGEALALSWSVRNIGTKEALGNWTDRVWLSTDTVLNKVGANADILLHTQAAILTPLGTAGANALYAADASVLPPLAASLPTGSYYLIVETDAGGTVVESDEGNNATASAAVALTRPALPDLVVTDILAASSALPGSLVPLSWTVENQGTAAAVGPWTERVYLSSDNVAGNDQFLATFTYAGGLAAGLPAVRNEVVTLPSHGISGSVWFVVETDAGKVVVEVSEANSTIDDASVNIPLGLSLMLTRTDVREDAGSLALRGVVTRNGSTASPLVVTVASSDTTELTAPATVTIPAGQLSTTFELTPMRDQQVDGPQSVTVSVSATGYTTALGSAVVLDVDQPALLLTIDASSLTEGTTATATLTRDFVSASPITVLVSTNGSQLNVPLSVTIAANEASTTFAVAAVDDELIEATRSVSVDVAAGGFTSASAAVNVVDNDIPSITLAILPSRISEGAGGMAAGGVVTRSIVSHQPLVVLLRSLDTSEVTVPDRVTIPADQAAATFSINAVDDTDVDGEQLVTILAMVTETTTRVPLPGVEATAQITVTDNDGPTLRVTFDRDLVPEGYAAAATGTVTRNTPPNGDLLVQLVSDRTGELTVPATVLIPNGQTSATFPVTSIEDLVADGNQTVTVTASTAGYTAGFRSIVVSDVDLPDLVVRNVGVPASATTEQYFDVSYRIANDGIATAIPTNATPTTPGTWQERVFLSPDPYVGDDTLVGNFTFTGSLPVGQSFERTVPVRAPQKPGNYWIIVTTDLNNTVIEGLESNNTRVSDSPAVVLAEYTASVQTNVDVGLAGQAVPLTGQAVKAATGQPVPFALVNIHISVRGTKRVISAITDSAGRFATTFTPLPGEGGHYTIGAAHPGLDNAPVQDEFMLLGIRAEPARGQATVTETESTTGQITLRNTSDVLLTGLSVEVLSKPGNLNVTASLATTVVDPLAAVTLSYEISAINATTANGIVTLRVHVPNGPTLDVPIDVRVYELVSQLTASITRLSASMLVGSQKAVEFTITNTGRATTGAIRVTPDTAPWLALATPATMPALAPNESASVTLLLTPPANLPLTAYNGNVRVTTDDGTVTIPFTFRAVSDATGDLVVTVVDEYFYFTDEAPKVEGATVLLLDAISGVVVAEAVTNGEGQVLFAGVTEGHYTVEVRAEDHDRYRNSLLLAAGETNDILAFISRETVKYTWIVEEVEIEDRTRITIESEFETNVPIPVVTIEPGVIDLAELTQIGQTMQIDMKITNHGLIAADGVALDFGTHPWYEITPLIRDVGLLPAKSSLTIPVIVRRTGGPDPAGSASSPDAAGAPGAIPCAITAIVRWFYICGPESVHRSTSVAIINVRGTCLVGQHFVPTGGGGGGDSVASRRVTPVSVARPSADCVECTPARIDVSLRYGGLFNTAINWVADRFTAVPYIKDIDVGVSGSASFERCCEDGQYGGWKVSGQGSLSGRLDFEWILAGGAIEFEDIGLWNGYQLDIELKAGLVLAGQVEVGGFVSGRTDCDLQNLQMCAGLSFDAALETGILGSVVVDLEQGNVEHKVIGQIFAGLRTTISGKAGWCNDGEGGCWNVTIGAVELVGEVRFVFGNLEGNAGVNIPISEGATFGEDSCDETGLPNPARAPQPAQANDPAFYAELAVFVATLPAHPDVMQLRDELEQRIDLHNGVAGVPVDGIVPVPGASSSGVCARVRIRIDQEAVMTRRAFRATLEISNLLVDAGIEDLSIDVNVYETTGDLATFKFGIGPPQLVGVDAIDGTGSIGAQVTGRATWLLVPTEDAAPLSDTAYDVAGVLTYTIGGTSFVVPMSPVRITVKPDAALRLKYFHQRDVFSDDPHTEDVIEPSQPFVLGVMVQNYGTGEARNLRISSAQPEIIENEKGLLIDFAIIASQLFEQDRATHLVPSLTMHFGNVAPGEIKVGQWLLTSTLQGQFIDYKATFEHIDGLGDPRLSLIKNVDIHELVHVVDASVVFPDFLPDYLANDVADADDLPETLHLSDGSVAPVATGSDATTDAPPSAGDLSVELSATMPTGWSYIRFADPGLGDYRLDRVLRSDGTELPTANFWQTDRTFIEQGMRPRLEDNIHLVDYNSTGSYTLVFAADGSVPFITELEEVTPDPRTTLVDELTVTFSEAIDPASMTVADLSLRYNGDFVSLAGTGVDVSPIDADNRTFQITGLAALTGEDGEYALTVDAAGVFDVSGNAGLGTATETWLKADAAPTIVLLSSLPPVTRTPIDSVDVTFSEPINLATFGVGSVMLRRDGLTVPAGSTTYAQIGESAYRISGLAPATFADGFYILTVSAAGVSDLVGTLGVGSVTVSWTVDATPPTVVDVVDVSPDPRNTSVATIDVLLSEAIDLSTFGFADVTLTRDGGANLITSGVTISHVTGTRYRIAGLSGLTTTQGNYQLAVNLAGVMDTAGNSGSNSGSDSWTVDTSPPLPATNRRVSPDTGVSSSDGRTNVLQMTISGALAETGLRVELLDLTTGTSLGTVASAGTTFAVPVQFSVVGTHLVRVRATDTAGNTADATITIFVDTSLPVVTVVAGAPSLPSSVPVDSLDITFSEPIDLVSFSPQDIELSLYGTAVSIPAGATFMHLTGSTYRLAGLSGATDQPGRYGVSVRGANFLDLAGNTGSGSVQASWINADIDDSLGARVSGIWVRGTTWTDEFKDELARLGLGDDGYSLVVGSCDQLLDLPWTNINQIVVEFDEDVFVSAADLKLAGLNRTNYPIRADQFQYDPVSRRAVWTLGVPIAADKLLLTVSEGIKDLVGNPLDGDWSNVIGQYPSGDGRSGGDFRFLFTVLPGDVTRDGTVDRTDVILSSRSAFFDPTHGAYDPFHDVDADGRISVNDAVLTRNHQGLVLPTGNLQGGVHPASVVNVLFASSRWSQDQRMQADPQLALGLAIPVGTCDQFETIPLTWLDQISIVFSEDMVVAAGDLKVFGVNQQQYAFAPGGFAYDDAKHAATWTLAQPVLADKVLLRLADSVQSSSGRALDGEWTDIAQVFSSGDGIPGGDFTFRFNVVAGDFDHSGTANITDIRTAAVAVLENNVAADVNFDGIVNYVDLIQTRNQQTRTLPAGEPTLPAGAAAPSAVVRRAHAIAEGRSSSAPEFSVDTLHDDRSASRLLARRSRNAPQPSNHDQAQADLALGAVRNWSDSADRSRARAVGRHASSLSLRK